MTEINARFALLLHVLCRDIARNKEKETMMARIVRKREGGYADLATTLGGFTRFTVPSDPLYRIGEGIIIL